MHAGRMSDRMDVVHVKFSLRIEFHSFLFSKYQVITNFTQPKPRVSHATKNQSDPNQYLV